MNKNPVPSCKKSSEPRAKVVDRLASVLLSQLEEVAPVSGDADLASAGDEALVAALIRRVGPFTYSSKLAVLIPASKA